MRARSYLWASALVPVVLIVTSATASRIVRTGEASQSWTASESGHVASNVSTNESSRRSTLRIQPATISSEWLRRHGKALGHRRYGNAGPCDSYCISEDGKNMILSPLGPECVPFSFQLVSIPTGKTLWELPAPISGRYTGTVNYVSRAGRRGIFWGRQVGQAGDVVPQQTVLLLIDKQGKILLKLGEPDLPAAASAGQESAWSFDSSFLVSANENYAALGMGYPDKNRLRDGLLVLDLEKAQARILVGSGGIPRSLVMLSLSDSGVLSYQDAASNNVLASRQVRWAALRPVPPDATR